ncbi:hypothetical protein G6L35_23605 [Agrobacterium tumefaciens]|nr:hypothetical protein [Agrobacterium tumefaciens]NSZ71618.1 hypothetical protein [Agrobacterium tumefaciens]
MTAAASMKDILVGMVAAIPPPTIPMTRSPTARPVTSFPTAVTSPSDLKAEDVTVPVSLSAIDAFTLKKVCHLSPSLPIDRFRISLAKCLSNFSAQSLTV